MNATWREGLTSSGPAEGSAATARESVAAGGNGGTIRESANGDPSGDGGAGFVRVGLLPVLSDRFTACADLGGGGEADVLLVRDTAGTQWVVKQYRKQGWAPSAEVLDSLAEARDGVDPDQWAQNPQTSGVVWLQDCGTDPGTGLFYEVQEYVQGGTLAQGLGEWPIPALVESLAGAVSGFHHLVGAHRDIKPENVLVRDPVQPVLVLADIGLSREVSELSARYSRRDGSAAYQAPESAQGLVSRAGDWWSVGMIVAEAALGFQPWTRPDRSLLPDQVIHAELAQRGVPHLDTIADERVQLLCRGLLTRDAEQRWRAAQVRQWLAGESPHVADSTETSGAAAASVGPARARRVLFGGVDYDSPQGLAAGFAADPQRGGELLFQAKDPVLLEDLRLMLSARGLNEAQSVISGYQTGAWQPSFLRLIAEMDPELPPTLAGQDMTPAGVGQVAQQVVAAGVATPTQTRVLEWINAHDLWRIWRNLPDMEEAAATHDRVRAVAEEYNGGRGMFVDRHNLVLAYSGHVEISQDASRPILIPSATIVEVLRNVRPLASSWTVLAAQDPNAVATNVDRTLGSVDVDGQFEPWWGELASSQKLGERIFALTTSGLAQQAETARLARVREDAEDARKAAKRAEIDEELGRRRSRLQSRMPTTKRLKSHIWAWFWLGALSAIPVVVYVNQRQPRTKYLAGAEFAWMAGGVWLAAFILVPLFVVWITNQSRDQAESRWRRERDSLGGPRYNDPAYEWNPEDGDWVEIQ